MAASDPLDSDEEDELDALSRNGAGVPVVGHALVESRRIEDFLNHSVPVAQALSPLRQRMSLMRTMHVS